MNNYYLTRSKVAYAATGIMALFLFAAFTATASFTTPYSGNESVIESRQNRWVNKTSRQLKKLKPENCTQPIEPRVVSFDGHFLISYRVDSNSGCIHFPNGDWIYMITHSIHDDPAIGDISVAIDNRQRLYYNTGHVCGGIINFYIDTEIEIHSAQDFFNSFLSDCDDCKWKERN